MEARRIGFIGAGQMATALARGFLAAGCCRSDQIIASDMSKAARDAFQQATGIVAGVSNSDVVANSEIVFLAVKPQSMRGVVSELSDQVGSRHLIISIAAGITLASLKLGLGATSRLVRVMPNTPCLVGASASAFARGGAATDEDGQLVTELLSAVGIAYELPEPLLDTVTGLSGSGPAFVYVMIEALSDGGVRMGLPRDVATRLAAQTVMGAAKMVLETGLHPGALKDAVASPGGTTIAGLHALEQGGLRGCLMNAVQAATARSRELGESSDSQNRTHRQPS